MGEKKMRRDILLVPKIALQGFNETEKFKIHKNLEEI